MEAPVATFSDKYTDITTFCHAYNASRETLETLHKNTKDIWLSIDVLVLHFPDVDLTHLKAAVNAQHAKMDAAKAEHLAMRASRQEKMAESLKIMMEELSAYKSLENLEAFKSCPDDAFMVEMSRLLYPHVNDSLQIRQDPPIADVYKCGKLVSTMDVEVDGVCPGLRGLAVAPVTHVTPVAPVTKDIAQDETYAWRL